MNLSALRRSMRMSAIVLILCIFNTMRVFKDTSIRSVDILSILSLGVIIGVLLVQLAIFIRLRKQEKAINQ